MIEIITKSWVFTAAQTDLLLESVGGSARFAPVSVVVTCANSNTADTSVRLGLATTTLPTITNNSATGMSGMFFEHGGIARGGGAVASNGGSMLAVGALGVGPRLTCSEPTAGALRIVMAYQLLE